MFHSLLLVHLFLWLSVLEWSVCIYLWKLVGTGSVSEVRNRVTNLIMLCSLKIQLVGHIAYILSPT